MENERKERLKSALSMMIKDMDVPEMRRQLRDEDINWLVRNLGINNGQDPAFQAAALTLRKLAAIVYREDLARIEKQAKDNG